MTSKEIWKKKLMKEIKSEPNLNKISAKKKKLPKNFNNHWKMKLTVLTEVAGEGGPDLAPQKFLLSQKFRHLMGWRNMRKKIFLPCLVSEIQLFVYIFGQNSIWPPEVRVELLPKNFPRHPRANQDKRLDGHYISVS